jgi:hypothetical protein
MPAEAVSPVAAHGSHHERVDPRPERALASERADAPPQLLAEVAEHLERRVVIAQHRAQVRDDVGAMTLDRLGHGSLELACSEVGGDRLV